MHRALTIAPVIVPWLLVLFGVGAQVLGLYLLTLRVTRPSPPAARGVAVADWSADDADSLAIVLPIDGARVPDNPDLLPGASRSYRGGQHQGVDFRCRSGAPVLAAGDGWVLSIDDEPNLPEARRIQVLAYTQALGETPPEVLQVLHGRRIVLCHGIRGGKLLTTSYSHLERIRPDLKPGDCVDQGEVIAAAGASGTSHAYRRDGWAEVHFEVRLNGEPLGNGLAPAPAGALYRSLLGKDRAK